MAMGFYYRDSYKLFIIFYDARVVSYMLLLLRNDQKAILIELLKWIMVK